MAGPAGHSSGVAGLHLGKLNSIGALDPLGQIGVGAMRLYLRLVVFLMEV